MAVSYPVIDRYEIRRGLGRGAMGSVYLAWDPKLGREVAIKVLQKEFALRQKHRQRFEREAMAIAALNHPSVVEIYDFGGSPDEHLYLVMEFVRGPHTGQLCREKGIFPESMLAACGIELAGALGCAHADGIIHRDLKPENVFVDKGRLVLADFGIAKAIRETNPLGAAAAKERTDIIGTPGFMAPEQLEQNPLDERTDIFAFGALLYYLASRQLPYQADSPYGMLQAFREQKPIPLVTIKPQLSEELSDLVDRCIAVDVEERPQTIEAVRSELLHIFERSGAQLPREVLRKFEEDPPKYRLQDRHQVIDYLLRRLKLAVQNQDGVEADYVRGRLAILDPENDEASHVTGVAELIDMSALESEPDLVLRRSLHRRWLATALTIASLIVVVTFLALRQSGGPQTRSSEYLTARHGTLVVHAGEPTEVFFSGRSLGYAPDFPPTAVPTGVTEMEFVGPLGRRLSHRLRVAAEDKVVLVVDWRRSTVKRKRAKKKRRRKARP